MKHVQNFKQFKKVYEELNTQSIGNTDGTDSEEPIIDTNDTKVDDVEESPKDVTL
jgi:hypothetical protein